MTDVSRGRKKMGVKVQARVESALEAPAKVAPSKRAGVDRGAVWDRMDAPGSARTRLPGVPASAPPISPRSCPARPTPHRAC